MNEITKAIAALPAEQQREWKESHGDGEDSPLSLRWDTSPMWTPEHRGAVAAAIHDICLGSENASEALKGIVVVNRDLGALLACAVARSVLHLVDELDERPRYAIESAELLIGGIISRDECRQRIRGAATSANESLSGAAMAAHSAGLISVLSRTGVGDVIMAGEASTAVNLTASAIADERCNGSLRYEQEKQKVMKDLRSVLGVAARDAIDAIAALHERAQKELP